jgi:hypothetical protein
MDTASPAALRSVLLAQTEELIGRGEQNRTRLLMLIERQTAAGLPTAEADELLSLVEERLTRLHAWRQLFLS